MNIDEIGSKIQQYIEDQIAENHLFDNPLVANKCLASAIEHAIGEGTKEELNSAEKVAVLMSFTDFSTVEIGCYGDPDDTLEDIINSVFKSKIFKKYETLHNEIAAETINKHLLENLEVISNIIEYNPSSTHFNVSGVDSFKVSFNNLKNKTAEASDIELLLLSGDLLYDLRSRRNDHKLHVKHGTAIEAIDHVTEKMRQLHTLGSQKYLGGSYSSQLTLDLVARKNNETPSLEEDEVNTLKM